MYLPNSNSFQKGGLDFPYSIGPGPAVVHLKTEMNFTVTPIWNVIAKIPGDIEPDRMIILGNHRDAWVMGAVGKQSQHYYYRYAF